MILRTVFLLLLMVTESLSADHSTNHTEIKNTIVVLGDSLSAAYGIDEKQGWVNLLARRLKNNRKYTQWQVINTSVSGDTTAGGLARLPGLLEDHKPSLCIIALGANNGLRGQSLKLMEQHLNEMVTACKQTGTSILVGMRLPPNYGEQYASAFHSVFANVAEKNQIERVPFMLEKFALEDRYFQQDRLHPTTEAQPLILETIWPAIEKVLATE